MVFGGERLGTVSAGGSVRKQHTTSREELKASTAIRKTLQDSLA